ncbi:MAG: histidine triad nucleotide-binding protein [Pseudomonadota bacterium]
MSDNNCLFCKIVTGEIPANIVYEDDDVMAFDDIHPKAPVHKLIIPKKHIATLNDLTNDDMPIVGKLLQTAKLLAAKFNIAESGYRTVINCLDDGGQEVYHLHLHLLGGHRLRLPIG